MTIITQTKAPNDSANGHSPPEIPKPLQAYDQWLCYRRKQKSDGKIDKIPTDPHISGALGNISKTDPANWLPYQQAWAYVATVNHIAGAGFFLRKHDPFAVIDLDGCLNPETDEIEGWAWEIIKAFNSYTEVSPSGTGVHIWVYGTVRGTTRPEVDGHRIEAYSENRFVTVTGDQVDGTPGEIVNGQDVLDNLSPATSEPTNTAAQAPYIGLIDEEILSKVRAATNGGKFRRLFDRGDISAYGGDESAADMALAGILAFYTGNDVEQAARLMHRSKLYRDKYERPDYLPRTINKALSDQAEFYGASAGEAYLVSPSLNRQGQQAHLAPIPTDNLKQNIQAQSFGTAKRPERLGGLSNTSFPLATHPRSSALGAKASRFWH